MRKDIKRIVEKNIKDDGTVNINEILKELKKLNVGPQVISKISLYVNELLKTTNIKDKVEG